MNTTRVGEPYGRPCDGSTGRQGEIRLSEGCNTGPSKGFVFATDNKINEVSFPREVTKSI